MSAAAAAATACIVSVHFATPLPQKKKTISIACARSIRMHAEQPLYAYHTAATKSLARRKICNQQPAATFRENESQQRVPLAAATIIARET